MFPCRYGRRNSMNPFLSGLNHGVCLVVVEHTGCLVLGSGRETWLCYCAVHTRFCWCVGVGQALGLLVPVGWALLLYTSGLSIPWSAGGLTPSCGWETLS